MWVSNFLTRIPTFQNYFKFYLELLFQFKLMANSLRKKILERTTWGPPFHTDKNQIGNIPSEIVLELEALAWPPLQQTLHSYSGWPNQQGNCIQYCVVISILKYWFLYKITMNNHPKDSQIFLYSSDLRLKIPAPRSFWRPKALLVVEKQNKKEGTLIFVGVQHCTRKESNQSICQFSIGIP